MRKFLLLSIVALASLATSSFAVQTPRKSPEFVIHMTDGSQKLLSSYKGKTIALAFMFTTCPHCQKTAGVLAKVQTEYAAKGVQVLGVTFDDGAQGRVNQFNQNLGLNFPCGYSAKGPVLEFLGIPVNEPFFVPILVFIDKTGNIRSEYIGDERFLLNQEVNIRAELDKYLKAGPVSAAKK
ncbi:MAG TPA: TlpA disulfide reductase family protein [Bryobacteraceae bacterium]|jgi:peroxiredoxin|nr:TlpA disulfide reductase family protein [Bryobacteraceae bacterium]